MCYACSVDLYNSKGGMVMNKTVIQLLLDNVKKYKKVFRADTPKKRAKYKKFQKNINILIPLLNKRGRDYIVQGEI